jgi:hypothetical protein
MSDAFKFGTSKGGVLQMQPSGRWAVCRPGRDPVEITSGECFRIMTTDGVRVTRMEFSHARRGYYCIDGYELSDGLWAAIGGAD